MSNIPPPSFGPPGGPVDPQGSPPPAGPGANSGSSVPSPPPPTDTPRWSGFQPGTPGGPGHRPQPYTTAPAPKRGGNRRVAVIVAVVLAVIAAAVVIGVLVFDLGKDDIASTDTEVTEVTDDTAQPTGTTETAATVVVTQAPATTAAPTTTATPETTAVPAPTTTVPAVPAGAIDLGRGVYIPLPVGWTHTDGADEVVVLSDGVTSVAVQVLARTPGENPAALIQEYVDTFDSDFESVSYSPTANIRRLDGEPAVDVYNTFYLTYDAAADASISGAVNVYLRGDGLSLIYDVYGPTTTTGSFPSDAADAMRLSLQRAPQVNPPVALAPAAPFRVTSVHPFVQVDGLIGFSTAAGFTVFTSGNNRGLATNGTEDFQVDKVLAQPDTDAVTAAAQAVIAENYTAVEYTALSLSDPDPFGIVHGSFGWTGTYVGGNPSAGGVDFYYDPATLNAYVVLRAWFTGTDDSEPFPAHTQFMLRSMFTSFTTIP